MKKISFVVFSFFLLFIYCNISAQKFDGQWEIVNSQDVNGVPYSGSIRINKITDEIYEVSFTFKYEGNEYEIFGRGIGIARENKLYVAREIVECDECGGDLYGVAVFNVKDTELEGKWTTFGRETRGQLGEEIISINKEELDGEYYWNGPYPCTRKISDKDITKDSVYLTKYGDVFNIRYYNLYFNEPSEFLDSYSVEGMGIYEDNIFGIALYGSGLFSNPIEYVEYEFNEDTAIGKHLDVTQDNFSIENLQKL